MEFKNGPLSVWQLIKVGLKTANQAFGSALALFIVILLLNVLVAGVGAGISFVFSWVFIRKLPYKIFAGYRSCQRTCCTGGEKHIPYSPTAGISKHTFSLDEYSGKLFSSDSGKDERILHICRFEARCHIILWKTEVLLFQPFSENCSSVRTRPLPV